MICYDYFVDLETEIDSCDIKVAQPLLNGFFLIENTDGLFFKITATDYFSIISRS